jgi:hypothetical protein
MNKSIFWLPEASETYYQNIEYLRLYWYEEIVDNFKNEVERHLKLIADNPLLFRVHDKDKAIHKCLIVKQITLFYKVSENKIELLTFWNNYKNPSKLRL